MQVSARERDVLKLVHPGRFVEIHRKPITAQEIMNKYPRHCVARPDVFRFPWIVVKPEAVLVPGKVFYIVPHRTIYKLLKEARERNQDRDISEQEQYYSPDDRRNQCYNDSSEHCCHNAETDSPLKCSAGTTPKHLVHDRNHERPYDVPGNGKHREVDSPYVDRGKSCARSWQEENKQKLNGFLRLNQVSPVGSSSEGRPSCLQDHCSTSKAGCSKQVELRSCLRKQDSSRKFLNFRVTFGSFIIIPTSPRQSPSPRDRWRPYQINECHD